MDMLRCETPFVDVLDDALRLLAQGCDAEYIARCFPEHTDQLYPLLLVMESLLELRGEAERAVQPYEACRPPLDLDRLPQAEAEMVH